MAALKSNHFTWQNSASSMFANPNRLRYIFYFKLYIHSSKPPITHGNLFLNNILLDSNHISRLSDLGINHFIPDSEKLSVTSDIYSFGFVLLRILTGRPASSVDPVNRPNLADDVLSKLEIMRNLFTVSTDESENQRQIPSYFVCPIFQ
ncbi:U-box domain-containing protein 32 isoform X1, partial [Tanacetum coccineum]